MKIGIRRLFTFTMLALIVSMFGMFGSAEAAPGQAPDDPPAPAETAPEAPKPDPPAAPAEPATAPEEPVPSGPYDPQPEEPAKPAETAPEPEKKAEKPAEKKEEKPAEKPTEKPNEKKDEKPARPRVPKSPTFSVTGARPMDLTDTAIRLDLGYPEVTLAYHMPYSRKLEFAPALGMFYGWNGATAGAVTGLFARCETKWLLMDKGEHAVALFADPGIAIPMDPEAGLAFMLGGPGVIYDHTLKANKKSVQLTAAFQVPVGFLLSPDVAVRFPLLLRTGAEFHVARDLNVFFRMAVGADIWSNNKYPADEEKDAVELFGSFMAGLAIRL